MRDPSWPWTAILSAAESLRFAYEPANEPANAPAGSPNTSPLWEFSEALSRALGADLADPRVQAIHAFATAVEAASYRLKADREQDQRTIADLQKQVAAERECMRATARELGELKVRQALAQNTHKSQKPPEPAPEVISAYSAYSAGGRMRHA